MKDDTSKMEDRKKLVLENYEKGFATKCAEYSIDPDKLLTALVTGEVDEDLTKAAQTVMADNANEFLGDDKKNNAVAPAAPTKPAATASPAAQQASKPITPTRPAAPAQQAPPTAEMWGQAGKNLWDVGKAHAGGVWGEGGFMRSLGQNLFNATPGGYLLNRGVEALSGNQVNWNPATTFVNPFTGYQQAAQNSLDSSLQQDIAQGTGGAALPQSPGGGTQGGGKSYGQFTNMEAFNNMPWEQQREMIAQGRGPNPGDFGRWQQRQWEDKQKSYNSGGGGRRTSNRLRSALVL
jgi:hypothetical protein